MKNEVTRSLTYQVKMLSLSLLCHQLEAGQNPGLVHEQFLTDLPTQRICLVNSYLHYFIYTDHYERFLIKSNFALFKKTEWIRTYLT